LREVPREKKKKGRTPGTAGTEKDPSTTYDAKKTLGRQRKGKDSGLKEPGGLHSLGSINRKGKRKKMPKPKERQLCGFINQVSRSGEEKNLGRNSGGTSSSGQGEKSTERMRKEFIQRNVSNVHHGPQKKKHEKSGNWMGPTSTRTFKGGKQCVKLGGHRANTACSAGGKCREQAEGQIHQMTRIGP